MLTAEYVALSVGITTSYVRKKVKVKQTSGPPSRVVKGHRIDRIGAKMDFDVFGWTCEIGLFLPFHSGLVFPLKRHSLNCIASSLEDLNEFGVRAFTEFTRRWSHGLS